MEVAIKYDPTHKYAEDDYQGASLQSIVSVLERKQYRLVACNISGVNAFFVKASELPPMSFGDPQSVYQPSRIWLTSRGTGLAASLKFARDRLSSAKIKSA